MQNTPARRVFLARKCLDCPVRFTPAGSQQVRCPVCRDVHAATVAREAHLRKLVSKKAARAAARLTGPKCSECGAPLRRNNTIGRCQEHRYIGEGMGECAHCGEPTRRDNKTGYCTEHKYPTSRGPVRICASREGCDQQLRVDNESGYCVRHFRESALWREYRDRQNARLRERTRLRPDTRKVCSIDGCPNRLRSDNSIGRCTPEHAYLPLDLPECAVDGCTTQLNTNNTIGRCMKHRAQYWAPGIAKCRAEGCGKPLNTDNMIGYCRKHRALSPTRREYNQEYYKTNQAALREYAALYRQIYTEEHREASRRWARENPALRSAARMRRRMKAQDGLTDLDLLMSLARCMEMTGEPCFYCGAPSEEVEHYFPVSKGGTDAWQNILPACMPCNHGVGGKHSMCGTAFMLWRGDWKPFMPPEPALNEPVAA